MAKPVLVPGTLYINRDRDYRSGEWGPYVKIGIVRNTREAASRNKEHQTGNPREVVTLKAMEAPMVEHLETQLHHRFATRWLAGEWFEMDDAFVKKMLVPSAIALIDEQKAALDDFRNQHELKDVASSGRTRAATAEERDVWEQALAADGESKRAMAVKNRLDAVLRSAVGGSSGISGVVTLVRKIVGRSFDEDGFAAAHPSLAKQYTALGQPKTKGSLLLKGSSSLSKLAPSLDAQVKEAKATVPTFRPAQLEQAEQQRSADIIAVHAQYVASLAAVAEAEWRLACFKARLARMLGNDDAIEGMISWKRVASQSMEFDTRRFEREHPELFHQFKKPGREVVSVTVHSHRAYPLGSRA